MEEFLALGADLVVEGGAGEVVGVYGGGAGSLDYLVGDGGGAEGLAVDVGGGGGPGEVHLAVGGLGHLHVGGSLGHVETHEGGDGGGLACALVVGADDGPGVVAVGGHCVVLEGECCAGLDAGEGLDELAVALDLDLGQGGEVAAVEGLGGSLAGDDGLEGAGGVGGGGQLSGFARGAAVHGSADGDVGHEQVEHVLGRYAVDADAVGAGCGRGDVLLEGGPYLAVDLGLGDDGLGHGRYFGSGAHLDFEALGEASGGVVAGVHGEAVGLAGLELDARGDQPVVHLVFGVVGGAHGLLGLVVFPGLAVFVDVDDGVKVGVLGYLELVLVGRHDLAQAHPVGLGGGGGDAVAVDHYGVVVAGVGGRGCHGILEAGGGGVVGHYGGAGIAGHGVAYLAQVHVAAVDGLGGGRPGYVELAVGVGDGDGGGLGGVLADEEIGLGLGAVALVVAHDNGQRVVVGLGDGDVCVDGGTEGGAAGGNLLAVGQDLIGEGAGGDGAVEQGRRALERHLAGQRAVLEAGGQVGDGGRSLVVGDERHEDACDFIAVGELAELRGGAGGEVDLASSGQRVQNMRPDFLSTQAPTMYLGTRPVAPTLVMSPVAGTTL